MIIASSSEWLATNHDSDFIIKTQTPSGHRRIGQRHGLTCRLYGTDLLRCSLPSFCWREKLRHDFALKLHESSDVPVDERAVPASFVVTISGMLVWSCNEFLLIFTRLRYGIYSDFYGCHSHTHSKLFPRFYYCSRWWIYFIAWRRLTCFQANPRDGF